MTIEITTDELDPRLHDITVNGQYAGSVHHEPVLAEAGQRHEGRPYAVRSTKTGLLPERHATLAQAARALAETHGAIRPEETEAPTTKTPPTKRRESNCRRAHLKLDATHTRLVEIDQLLDADEAQDWDALLAERQELRKERDRLFAITVQHSIYGRPVR